MPNPIHTNSWQVSLFKKAMALIDFETTDQMTMVSGKSDHCCNPREMLQVPNMLNILLEPDEQGLSLFTVISTMGSVKMNSKAFGQFSAIYGGYLLVAKNLQWNDACTH
jgi:hypothetical protein